jgi:hypothetical protein
MSTNKLCEEADVASEAGNSRRSDDGLRHMPRDLKAERPQWLSKTQRASQSVSDANDWPAGNPLAARPHGFSWRSIIGAVVAAAAIVGVGTVWIAKDSALFDAAAKPAATVVVKHAAEKRSTESKQVASADDGAVIAYSREDATRRLKQAFAGEPARVVARPADRNEGLVAIGASTNGIDHDAAAPAQTFAAIAGNAPVVASAVNPPASALAAPQAPAPAATRVRTLDRAEIAGLVKRGEQLMQNGDLASARLLLQRAAEANDVSAALSLGASYDPNVLQKLRVYGPAGDVGKARFWYDKAREFGSAEAVSRIEQLAHLGQ